jgi:metal-responsive CopG/Arc/MetJ family transcriptional regulator
MSNQLDDTTKKVRINIWIPEYIHKSLESVSRRDGRTVSDIVREALKDFIIKDKQMMSICGERYGED